MQVRILPAAPLPDGVKVARRPVKPGGVGASPTLAANFWKAGRYKLAAPVSKTGSVFTEAGALPAPSANPQPSTDQSHDDQPPIAKVAGAHIRQTAAQTGDSGTVEATTVAADAA